MPRGNFEGVTNIVTGDNILGGIGEVVLNTAGDALGGLGAGALVSNTAKGAAKEGGKVAIKEALKKEAAKEAAKAFVPAVAMANISKDSLRKKGRKFKRFKGAHTNNNHSYQQPDRQWCGDDGNNGGGDREEEGQGSDEEWSDEDESTTEESETEESSEEESSEEDQCRAMRSDGTPCTR